MLKGLARIKLRRRIAGCDTNLLAVFYGDDRMTGTRYGDIADDGDELAAQVGEVADFGAVAGGNYRLERTLAAGAEREMGVAGLADGDAEASSGNASVLAN